MKIAVLNGSPKSDNSVTMQYVEYIRKKLPEHEFKTINIVSSIKKIENDQKTFDGIIQEIKSSDGVLWAFPLYFFLVHGNYKRFIELLFERHSEEAFRGKFAAALSTSIHFYDHTAHNYIHAITEDLGMKYSGYYSADMNDLLNKGKREEVRLFAESFLRDIKTNPSVTKTYRKIEYNSPTYQPSLEKQRISAKGKNILIVTDSMDKGSNLEKMIERLCDSYQERPEIVDISKISVKGGCLGCIHCGFDNQCVYDGVDDIRKVFEQKIAKADILINAGTIKDRFLSSVWKSFMDRSFFNTHQPNFVGRQVGYMISGPLSSITNVREIIQAYVEINEANLVDIITDENEDSKEQDSIIDDFAKRLIIYSEENRKKKDTFRGVAAIKLFRDEFWGKLRYVFPQDHKYYKKNGKYDFPQKDIRARLMNAIMMPLIKIPFMKRRIQKNLLSYMVSPFKKLLNSEKLL